MIKILQIIFGWILILIVAELLAVSKEIYIILAVLLVAIPISIILVLLKDYFIKKQKEKRKI